jgi:hypothetical protein
MVEVPEVPDGTTVWPKKPTPPGRVAPLAPALEIASVVPGVVVVTITVLPPDVVIKVEAAVGVVAGLVRC